MANEKLKTIQLDTTAMDVDGGGESLKWVKDVDGTGGSSLQGVIANDIARNIAASRSFAEGNNTQATGDNSHSEGYDTRARGRNSHAEGNESIAGGDDSHAEGRGVTRGLASHAEGHGIAGGRYSHAEGESAVASGNYSHAEGTATASGVYAHAEGVATASGNYSHAEGQGVTIESTEFSAVASGDYSHAEGQGAAANGEASHAQNYATVANGQYQTVLGKLNSPDTTSAVIVGNGTASNGTVNQSNAFTMDWDGNGRFAGHAMSTVETITVSFTRTGGATGTTISNVYARRAGNIVTVNFRVNTTTAVAAGSNIITANLVLPSGLAFTLGANSASYNGATSAVALMGNNGGLTVRAISQSAANNYYTFNLMFMVAES